MSYFAKNVLFCTIFGPKYVLFLNHGVLVSLHVDFQCPDLQMLSNSVILAMLKTKRFSYVFFSGSFSDDWPDVSSGSGKSAEVTNAELGLAEDHFSEPEVCLLFVIHLMSPVIKFIYELLTIFYFAFLAHNN